MTEAQIVDGLRVRILKPCDYAAGTVLTLSREPALRLIGLGHAELSADDEPGQAADLLAALKRSPANVVELAFGARMDVDAAEALLEQLVKAGRVSTTQGRKYQRIYFLNGSKPNG